MSEPLACDFRDAELNHLRDALKMTVSQRWQWLGEAMDFGFQLARSRAEQGLVTFDPHGEVLWSPELERQWRSSRA